MKVRIGTRGSDLALWQANHVAARLENAGAETELVVLKTRGDRIDDIPLSQLEGKAFFTAEIELALTEDRVDLAVHSHKDLPVEDSPGLCIAAVPERASIAERLLVRPEGHDPEALFLPLVPGARVGTSAPRRAEQLRALRPDLEVLDLRGNVPTRVKRLRERRYDAILLAAAGLDRLELDTSGLADVTLPTAFFVPAPAQGALAIQIRVADTELFALVREVLHDPETARAIALERELLLNQGGGCSLPLGASLEQTDEGWRMRAFLGPDHPGPGSPARWVEAVGGDPTAAAHEAARRLSSGRASGHGPLAGLRVALTGSSAGGTRLGERLAVLGAEVSHEPVLAFEDLADPDLAQRIGELRPGDGLALTSREAARRLGAALDGNGLPDGVRVAAVGHATARVLREAGLEPGLVGRGGAAELAAEWELEAGATVLFPCAEDALSELEDHLAARGIEAQRLPLYRTIARADASPAADVDARVYMSPSAVAAVLDWERAEPARAPVRVALGRTTGAALAGAGLEALTPENSSPEEAVRALAALARTRLEERSANR